MSIKIDNIGNLETMWRIRDDLTSLGDYLCCHVLIGTPGSGKSTFAEKLKNVFIADIISTDGIRKYLYNDEAYQGNWKDIERYLHKKLIDKVSSYEPVIIDGTHVKPEWRTALTQDLVLPKPVLWIGWWMNTPLHICHIRNKLRKRRVPGGVINSFHKTLKNNPPTRKDGFKRVYKISTP